MRIIMKKYSDLIYHYYYLIYRSNYGLFSQSLCESKIPSIKYCIRVYEFEMKRE